MIFPAGKEPAQEHFCYFPFPDWLLVYFPKPAQKGFPETAALGSKVVIAPGGGEGGQLSDIAGTSAEKSSKVQLDMGGRGGEEIVSGVRGGPFLSPCFWRLLDFNLFQNTKHLFFQNTSASYSERSLLVAYDSIRVQCMTGCIKCWLAGTASEEPC